MLFYWASRDLPDLNRIAEYKQPQATVVLARDGSTLGTLYHEKRFVIGLKDMSRYLPMPFLAAEDDAFYRHMDDPHVASLGEMMNYPGVLSGDPEVLEKIALSRSRRKPVDGHAPALLGRELDAYLCTGIANTHECTTAEEFHQNLMKPMPVAVWLAPAASMVRVKTEA